MSHMAEESKTAAGSRSPSDTVAKKNRRVAAVVLLSAALCAALVIFVFTVVVPAQNYSRAVGLMSEKKYAEAIDAFNSLGGYRDSADRLTSCRAVLSEMEYRAAVRLMDAGDLLAAYEAFTKLGGYKDSSDIAVELIRQYHEVEKLKWAETGDCVTFGACEQDGIDGNGSEPIEWLVLAREGNKALLISRYALDSRPYNSRYADITWETCTLREWLNGEFYDGAFSTYEKTRILTAKITADKNPLHLTDPGGDTQDKLFLLSITEAQKYFKTDAARACAPTEYAILTGVWISDSNMTDNRPACWWWLRTPGGSANGAAGVCSNGNVNTDGFNVRDVALAVRPALWIYLEP